VAVVDDGRLTAIEPDPSHPTGAKLCPKGRAAPELVYHPDRLTKPLRRTAPKGAADPGWQPISWDEALDEIAGRMAGIKAQHGAEQPLGEIRSCGSSIRSVRVLASRTCQQGCGDGATGQASEEFQVGMVIRLLAAPPEFVCHCLPSATRLASKRRLACCSALSPTASWCADRRGAMSAPSRRNKTVSRADSTPQRAFV
jgi:hypothetical protein